MMRFLIVVIVLVGSSLAQLPLQKRRPQPFKLPEPSDEYQDDEQQYQRLQKQQSQPQQHQQPQQDNQEHHPRIQSTTFIPIIRFDKEQGNDGSYKAAYETGNHIFAQEEGFLKNLGPDPDTEGQNINGQVQQGYYSYTSPEGYNITVSYIADETGFHPIGDHLPTPPPVSAEVQKGLDLIYAGIRQQQEDDEREAQNPQRLRNEIPHKEDGKYRQ